MSKGITVTSHRDLGRQIIKDNLTATEKRILLFMLNSGMTEGQVRNKVFLIDKTSECTANVTIETTTKSIILGRNETTRHKVEIKF